MRFQKGISYTGFRRPRGPGRGDPPYRMSRAAYQARVRNLIGWQRLRGYQQTRHIELEIALWTHRGGEVLRALARRLGLRSHAYCWRVARRYRTGEIPMLPRDEQGLLAMRESLDKPPTRERAVPWWLAREWQSADEIWGCILLTQEQKVQASAELERKEYARGS